LAKFTKCLKNKLMKKKTIIISGVIIILVFIFGLILLAYRSGQVDLFASGCNVQGIKLYGGLYTYKNAASDGSGQSSKDVASAEEITTAIEKANKDNSIKAILLEVDSSGGSPVGGWEIEEALKHSSKPTVALIRERGDSAGYLAASGAKYIIASANSDVGSIGVTMSYLGNADKNTTDGLTFYELSEGKFKDAGNPDKVLTQEEGDLFMRDVKVLYNNFIKYVSENRHLDIKKVTELADGSSMLGQMAKDNGLIDQVGGIYEVRDYLKKQIKTNANICW
jgi:protease-4